MEADRAVIHRLDTVDIAPDHVPQGPHCPHRRQDVLRGQGRAVTPLESGFEREDELVGCAIKLPTFGEQR
ncbi:hypothetical protein HRbin27_01285 [bacterium HR27]|nr:hypothetical protein HRbin27_01285 [bacterium HR27]